MKTLKQLLAIAIILTFSITGTYAQNYIEVGAGTVQNTMPI